MNENSKWLPTGVNEIINSLVFNDKEVVKKNIAYNIQYLQYLNKSIKENNVTSNIKHMKIKSFIITGMSIIEAIFISLLRERNLIPLDEWCRGKHSYKKISEEEIEVIYKKIKIKDPKEKKITLDEAIRLVEKNKILNIISQTYPVLQILKDLRNKLHLDKAENCLDSDYLSFDKETFEIMKSVLFHIMHCNNVSKNKEYIQFLKNNS